MVRLAPLTAEHFAKYGMCRTVTDLEHQWMQRMPLVQKALDHSGNTHSVDDVYALVLNGRAYFFPGKNAALVVEPKHYPMKSRLNFWLAAGNLKELIRLEGEATNFGKSIGLYEQEFSGRLGWEKIAKAHGWKKIQTVWHRDVRN